MAEEEKQPPVKRSRSRRVNWHKLVTFRKIGLIMVGLFVALGGFGMMAMDGNVSESPDNVQEVELPAGMQRNMLSQQDFEGLKVKAAEEGRTMWDKIGPWLIGAGISFAVGLIIGIMFRAFIKTAAVITAFAIAALIALTYFGVLSTDDVAGLRDHLGTAADTARNEAGNARSWLLTIVPNGIIAFVGFIFGFLRK